MGEKKTTPIKINDVEYAFEDLTQEQKMLVNHVTDLDRKLSSARFNLDQLQVGSNSFMQMLEQSLKASEELQEAKEDGAD